MHELTLHFDPATRQALDDLADARGRTPQEVTEEAVRRYLDEEALRVRSVGERLAAAHVDLLRRLGG
jgi:predicted transcriptional regulator